MNKYTVAMSNGEKAPDHKPSLADLLAALDEPLYVAIAWAAIQAYLTAQTFSVRENGRTYRLISVHMP